MSRLFVNLLKTTVALVTLLQPSTSLAREISCKGALGKITVSSIEIPKGRNCTLRGTTVRGNIVVHNGGTLKAIGIKVNGQLRIVGVTFLEISGNSVIRGGIVRGRGDDDDNDDDDDDDD